MQSLCLKTPEETFRLSWGVRSSGETTTQPRLNQNRWACELVGRTEVFAAEGRGSGVLLPDDDPTR